MSPLELPPMAHSPAPNPPAPPDAQQLALDRTYLAHERTLMAWIRTATSLITFGFTLYKFFQYLHEQNHLHEAQHPLGARTMGMIMIGLGVFTLAAATWQHRLQLKRLAPAAEKTPFSLALVVATLIAGLGILAFIAAVFRQ
jgi:putative membrane protein